MLKAWCNIPNFATDDMSVATWYEENRQNVHERVLKLKAESTSLKVAQMISEDRESGLRGVMNLLSTLPTAEKEQVLNMLSRA
jgi:acetyl-CoA carboxylase/biotin carboxylase 1